MSDQDRENTNGNRSVFTKEVVLFIVLGGFFICNALTAEFIGVKLFSMERLLGFEPMDLSVFGQEGLAFNLTAGVLIWPVVFIMTDVINDYYGVRGVRLLSYLTAALIGYSFFMFYFGMQVPAMEGWIMREVAPGVTVNMDQAFNAVFGQGMWIIVGSLTAFLIGQFVDAYVFRRIKRMTGDKRIWLRATVSTLFSQFIDSFVVLFIAFYLGAGWEMSLVLAIGVVNYIYKFLVAILLIPALYGIHGLIGMFLGRELGAKMRERAVSG